MRALSALVRVREVHVKELPLQCPWCVPLPVPVVRLFLVLHMYNRSVLQYCRYKKRVDTNEPRTNEISFNIKDNSTESAVISAAPEDDDHDTRTV